MRRLVILLLCLCCGLTASAQATASSQPNYKAEAFLGTWEWRSGTEVFRLTITREPNFPLPNGRTMHFLLGRHSYSRNGVVVEESYSNRPNDPTGRSFLGAPNQEWVIYMGYIDRTKDKLGRVDMTIDPNTPNQMQFELHETEGIIIKGPLVMGFTIPTSMTLTRVP